MCQKYFVQYCTKYCMHIVQYVQYNFYNIVHFVFVYCTNRTYCTYCAKRSNFVHIVHYCTCLYDILYKIVFQYCVQNCTLLHSIIYKIVHCKAPLARCPPAAPAPAQADCFACVASPHPFCRPRRVSCNALPLKSLGRALLFRIAPAAQSRCGLRRSAAAASGWWRRAVEEVQGVDETVNVLQDAVDLDILDDGPTAGAAPAFLGWRELLVPFKKLGAEKRPPSRVRWLLQERELRAVEDLVP